MTIQSELASWNPFASSPKTNTVPKVGEQAPSTTKLRFPPGHTPTVIVFLRHCGCPWAEKIFRTVRTAAEQNENKFVRFVAVSHSDLDATNKWLEAVGGAGAVEVIVDHEREIFCAYGLGLSSFWAVLNPWSMSNVVGLGRSEQIWNRPTESGSRWQTAGLFGIGEDRVIKYAHAAQTADDLGDVEKALLSAKD